jgi:hypothetical protein
VAGDWRKLHSEELHDFYCSAKMMRVRWAGHVAGMGEMRNACNVVRVEDGLYSY